MIRFGLGQLTLQRPPWDPRDHARIAAEALELARVAEGAGFDSFWVAEHHGAADGYLPAPLAFLAAVAARTERLEVGTAVLLAPLHHPLRLAEEAALVQNLSGGRLHLGLGLGWVADEYRMVGVPMRGRGRRLEEFVGVLRRAFEGGRFSFAGRHYVFEDVTVTPPPVRAIPIWLGGASRPAVERAARIADGHFPPSSAALEGVIGRAREVLEARRRVGATGPYRYGCFLPVGIGVDPDDGWARIRDGLLHTRGAYALWAQGRRDVDAARDEAAAWEDRVRAGAVTGTPRDVARALGPAVGALGELGFDEVVVSAILAVPGMPFEQAAEQVEAFGQEVIPALRRSRDARGDEDGAPRVG
jgi:probable F420-dependent oxidoreductase